VPPDLLPLPTAPADSVPADPGKARRDLPAAGRPVPPAPIVEPLLLAAASAARLCGVSPATWHRMNAGGRCPAPVRLSRGCVRWRAEELRDWIAAGCPDRRTWEVMRAAKNGSSRPR
jgi:predicted DNA-binding transcriptional regulator AlpA